MKVLLIDDENKARRLLEVLLKDLETGIEEYLHAADLLTGIEIIKKEKPQIVFLDIEMPGESGLNILNYFDEDQIDFQIIFVTAYNKYAIEAFKTSAVDYLLKPIDIQELEIAVSKAEKILKEKNINNNFNDLKNIYKKISFNKLALEIPKGIIFVPHEEILYFEADGMYTKIHLENNREELICKPLKHFVKQLENKPFFYKPHRSFLINLNHIREFSKKDGPYLILSNMKSIPISKDKRDSFLDLIKEFL